MRGKKYLDILQNKTPSVTISAINIALTLLVLNLLSDNLVIMNHSYIQTIAIYIILGILLLNLPIKTIYQTIRKKKTGQIKKVYFGLFLILFSLIIIIFSNIQMLQIATIALFLSGLDLSLRGIYSRKKELYLMSITSFIYAIFFIILQSVPLIWQTFQQISLRYSSIVGQIIQKPLLLGPSISGLWIVLSFIILIISSIYVSSNKKRITMAAIAIVVLLIIWTFYMYILGVTSFETKSDVVNYHYILYIICIIPIYFYLLKYTYKMSIIPPLNKLNFKRIIKNTTTWSLIFLLIAGIMLTAFTPSETKGEKILFYGQNSLGTWDVPAYGKYGREATGMFGLLPIYLSECGYENTIVVDNITTFLNTSQPVHENITRYINLTDYVKIQESSKITSNILEDTNVFVIANLNTTFSTYEKKIIWDFVNQGGSLLVLGDHTNVGGIEKPLNNLLEPVDIQFRFDSALPLDQTFKWMNSYQLLHHPIKTNNLDELQISVGASLNITTSFPLIIGRYALSDEGERSNEEMAYLGDYEYSHGEQIGDIILVAGTYYGEGKVLVFGDTSTFQNAAMPYSIPFIQNVFTWLTSSSTHVEKYLQMGISLFLLLVALVIYFIQKNNRLTFALFPITLCIALLISNFSIAIFSEETNVGGNVVYIDSSHKERFTIEPFTDESVNGLILNLNRNGYLPIILRDFSKEQILNAKILFFIAPTQALTADEVQFLTQYMYNGGIVVLSTGFEDKDASKNLLDKFNLDVEGIPLGPVPYVEASPEEYENEPRFIDSWPIILNQENAESYYNFTWNREFHLMAFVPHGTGGLLLISDSQYLLDKNIESIYDYWPGNIIFLKHILNDFKTREEAR